MLIEKTQTYLFVGLFLFSLCVIGSGTSAVHEVLEKETGLSLTLSWYVEMKLSAAAVKTSTFLLALGKTLRDFFDVWVEF